MKTLLFIFMLTLSLKADSVLWGRCVKSYYIIDGSKISDRVIFVNFSNNTTYKTSYTDEKLTLLNDSFNKYTYDSNNNSCVAKSSDNVFLSSLVGILIGFSILFFSIFLTIKIGAKK